MVGAGKKPQLMAMSRDVPELDQIRHHDDDEVETEEVDLSSGPSANVRRSLLAISKALEVEDFRKSDEEILNLTELLDSIYESASHDSEEALEEVHRFVSSPSSHQMAVDAIAMVTSRTVVKFADVSDRSKEISESIIKCFISACNPRDMFSAFCEALQSTAEFSTSPIHFVLLLGGLSQVLCNIKRHQIQQTKVALPVILHVVHVVLLDSENSYEDSITLVDAVISVATSIQLISDNLVGRMKQELVVILGLYVLQTMALVSKSNVANKLSNSISLMTKLSHFLPFCGFSYMGLITGSDLDAAFDVVCNECALSVDVDDSDDFLACFSFLKDGAALAVVWGYIFVQIEEAAGEKLNVVLNKLKTSHAERWQAVSMLRYVLSSVGYPWVIKDHVIDLMLNMVDKQIPDESNDENSDISSMFLSMQAIERVIIHAPDANLRKKSFTALKKMLSDIPALHRFDTLKALMKDSSSPSMVSLLIDLTKEKSIIMNPQEVEVPQSDQSNQLDIKHPSIQPSWFLNALELVEIILKPPVGGPPSLPENAEPPPVRGPSSLPENTESVLSALNLYRFILLSELSGKTNHSGALSKNNLRRAYVEWLLPLRSVLSGIEAELKNDTSEGTSNILCALNPVLLVLFRCIELVEDIQRTSV